MSINGTREGEKEEEEEVTRIEKNIIEYRKNYSTEQDIARWNTVLLSLESITQKPKLFLRLSLN